MHGFNQGKTLVKAVLDSSTVDFLLVQEHWLSNSELHKLKHMHPNYDCFATSAMEDRLGRDVLVWKAVRWHRYFLQKIILESCAMYLFKRTLYCFESQ